MLRPGQPVSSNRELVARTVEIARSLGRPPATANQARERLGLTGRHHHS